MIAQFPLDIFANRANAQGIRTGPGGGPPPRVVVRDELRDRMLRLHESHKSGERNACVRLGIIIGEPNTVRNAG